MEKKQNFGLRLSLKEISLRRLAVILCSQRNILTSIFTSDVVDDVERNMSKLNLPPSLLEEMKSLVQPIVTEIRNWNNCHNEILPNSGGRAFLKRLHKRFDVHILKQLCWTVLGTIDYRKSAEIITRQETFDIVKRYKLACLFCLDDHIPGLWEKLPEEIKRQFHKEERAVDLEGVNLEIYWTFVIKGEKNKLDNLVSRLFISPNKFSQYAFEQSACAGNKAATEYFYGKLTYIEREDSLVRTAREILESQSRMEEINGEEFLGFCSDVDIPFKKLSNTFCYLLSLMDYEQQMEIFKKYPCKVLIFLLNWPWQDLFLDIADLVWNFLSASDYDDLLNKISHKIILGYHLTKLFQDLFLRGSRDFRNYFVDKEFLSFFDPIFTFDENSETIKLIFRNLDSEYRKKLICSRYFLNTFYISILGGNWQWVELILQDARLSKEEKKALRESFFDKLEGLRQLDTTESVWEKFCQFVDESGGDALDQINLDEENLSKDKI